jgi:D-alanine--D-alanine ligase
MKVAFTHNLRLTDVRHSEKEAEFDSVDTVNAIAAAIEAAGHEVEKVEVSGPASTLLERLEVIDPDVIFNTAEGQQGKLREALYPALFEELGIPYTGSDAYANALTLDKWLTKLMVARAGVDTPRACLVNPRNFESVIERGVGLAFPVIVKPNHEGSSKGIYVGNGGSNGNGSSGSGNGNGGSGRDGSVVREARDLPAVLKSALRAYPDGVLVEEYVDGVDVMVGFIEGVGHDDGLLAPVELLVEVTADRPFNVWDYRLKNLEPGKVQLRCPASIPRDIAARLRQITLDVIRTIGLRDVARIDFRIAPDGRIYFLEANAIPSLAPSAPIFVATSQLGMGYTTTIAAILNATALRSGLATASQLGVGRRPGRSQPIRVGFTYNVKRDHDGDDEAEWDPPETIIAIANALARQGHIVVHLEATPDLPRVLAEADVDLIFNIAEGVEGRNREAQVPALCELLGVPYTGSDSATLAIALDKALCKKVLMQHDILTPKFQVMESARERLSPELEFPLIVKPNAEGSSKGIEGSTSVCDTEEELRAAVKACVERYRQPALVEEYIAGREFTVGLLGDKRPRVLAPMEICFKDEGNERPVYDYAVKQEWEKHVYYQCPAKLTESEQKAMEKIARATFWALDCRDVARVDLRMAADGRIYVLEVNPLPGLTPGYSDLVLIAQAVGIEYDSLIAEIMSGGLRRMREKRREEREMELGKKEAAAKAVASDAASKLEKAAEKAEKAAEKAEKAAKRMAKLAPALSGASAAPATPETAGNGNGQGNGRLRARTDGAVTSSADGDSERNESLTH